MSNIINRRWLKFKCKHYWLVSIPYIFIKRPEDTIKYFKLISETYRDSGFHNFRKFEIFPPWAIYFGGTDDLETLEKMIMYDISMESLRHKSYYILYSVLMWQNKVNKCIFYLNKYRNTVLQNNCILESNEISNAMKFINMRLNYIQNLFKNEESLAWISHNPNDQ